MVARVIHCKKCGMEADQYKDGYCEDCYAEVIYDESIKTKEEPTDKEIQEFYLEATN